MLYRRVVPSDPYSVVVPVEINDFGQIETTVAPSDQHLEVDYAARVDTQPVYQGFSAPGTATSDIDGWLLFRFTYDGIGRVTKREIARDSWDNRVTATYG